MKRLSVQPDWFEHRLDKPSAYDALHCDCGLVFAWGKGRVAPDDPARCPGCGAVEPLPDSGLAGDRDVPPPVDNAK